jgi:hypothetical protein
MTAHHFWVLFNGFCVGYTFADLAIRLFRPSYRK